MKKKVIVAPVHIFLAAHEPGARKELEGLGGEMPDEWVWERTIRFGGIPESLIHNKSFWRVYLPVCRADYRMLGRYDFSRIDLRTKIPATVFYSESDTPCSAIEGWKHYFIGKCEMVPFAGSHFFIYGHEQEIAEMLKKGIYLSI